MSDRTLSCARRIRQELAAREVLYTGIWQMLNNPHSANDDLDTAHAELIPLGIEVRLVVSVQLSWGGPSDWLEIELENSSEHDIRRVIYHFADWFDHAECELSEREAPALWRAAQYYVEDLRCNLADYIGATQ